MAKKRKQRRKHPCPGARLTRQRLLEGLPGPDESRVRLTRPEDSSRFAELLALATEDIEPAHVEGVEAGRCGRWLQEALTSGSDSLTEPLVRAAAAALALSLP